MASVFGVQEITLKPGIAADEFETFMAKEVFPLLHLSIHEDKMITHDFTKASWVGAKQYLFKGKESREYLRVLVGGFGAGFGTFKSENATHDEILAEAQFISSRFFEKVPRDAPHRLDEMITKSVITTFIEVAQFPLPKPPSSEQPT